MLKGILTASAGSAEPGPGLPALFRGFRNKELAQKIRSRRGLNFTPGSLGGMGIERRVAAIAIALAMMSAVAGARQSGNQEPPETPYQKAARKVAVAEAASREVLELRTHPDFVQAVSRDHEIETLLMQAQRVLRAAESGLARAEQTQSATGFSDSASLARRATRTFEQYQKRVREIIAQIEAARAPPTPPPPPPVEAEPEPSPDVAAEPPADAVAQPLAAPQVAPPPAAPPPAAAPVRRRSGPPPRKLSQAADAYFAGDYNATVTLLMEHTFKQRKARAHALLLRAAARYALFLLSGETDYALRGQAADDLAACREAAPDLAPDEGLFSPRFRDFFAATR